MQVDHGNGEGDRQERRKNVAVGGGGIGGLVLLGGGLAAAALIGAFIKKKKSSNKTESENEKREASLGPEINVDSGPSDLVQEERENDFVEFPMVSIGKEEDAMEEEEKSEEMILVYDNSDEESRTIDDNIRMDSDSEQNSQVRETVELVKVHEDKEEMKEDSHDSGGEVTEDSSGCSSIESAEMISSLKPHSFRETAAHSTIIHSSNWQGLEICSILVLILLLLLLLLLSMV